MTTSNSDLDDFSDALSRPDPLSFKPDDAGNARYCAELVSDRYAFVPEYGWLSYRGTHWSSKGATAQLRLTVIDALRERNEAAHNIGATGQMRATKGNRARINGAMEVMESYLFADIAEFDSDPDALNCANGVLDLCTGRLTPHDPAQRFTYNTGVNYDPDADATPWVEFLQQATAGNVELMEYLQLAVGYSLTGHTREEVFFYVWGPTRSGKGTFTETLRHVLGGPPLAAEVGFNTFTIKRGGDAQNFDLAPLKACRFVAAGESDRHDRLSSADLKRFTGGDTIRCSFKFKPVFEYRPQFKIWLASNEEPRADPDDDALWARMRIILFPTSRAGEEDKGLKQRMRSRHVLEGVLKWAVEGAIRWYRTGDQGLAQPDCVAELTRKVRQANDSVGQWIEERVRITSDPEIFCPNDVLYASYKNFCDQNGIQWPKTMAGLTRSLKTKGFRAGEVRTVNGHSARGCYGVVVR